jgi:hypothetical protein
MRCLRKENPGQRSCKCRGLEARVHMACVSNSEEPLWLEWNKQRERKREAKDGAATRARLSVFYYVCIL